MGIKALQKTIIAPEGTKGGATLGGTIVWRGMGQLKDDREVMNAEERIGIAVPSIRNYTPKLAGSISFESIPATYEQLMYILDAGIEGGVGVADGVGTDFIHTFTMPLTSAPDIRTYKIWTGDNTQARSMSYCFVESFSLSGEANDAVMMEATWQGRTVTDTTFPAATAYNVEEILGGKGSFYIGDSGTAFASLTQVTGTLLKWNLSVTTGWKTKYTVDDGQLYFNYAYYDIGSVSMELSLTYEHDSTGLAEIDKFEADATRLIRIEIEGSAVETPGTTYSNKTFILDVAGYYSEFSELTDQDGNSIVEATLTIGYSLDDAHSLEIVLVNELQRTSSFS